MRSSNLPLVFIYSICLLFVGCAIGMHWHGSPATALCVAILGAALFVLHDLVMILMWFSATAIWTQMVAKSGK